MKQIVLAGAVALIVSGCAAKQPPAPPPLNLAVLTPPRTETPPPPTAAQILAEQPPEVRAAIGQHEQSREWRSSPDAPELVRAYGSPTILIDGRDVAGNEAPGAGCCRIYQPQPGKFAAVPPVELILAALREAQMRQESVEAQNSLEKAR